MIITGEKPWTLFEEKEEIKEEVKALPAVPDVPVTNE